MKKNMGTMDRRVRSFVIAPIAVIVGLVVGPVSVVSIVLYTVALVMLATSSVSSCPLYLPLGVNTTGDSDGATDGTSQPRQNAHR
ncbi:MAG: YgaP family membrane protein [Actinomycetes bacterium]